MVELLQGRAIIRVIHPDGTELEAPPALLAIDKYRVVAASSPHSRLTGVCMD